MTHICDLPSEFYAEVFLSDLLCFEIISIPGPMPVFVVFNLVESYFMATELSDINSFVCYILVFLDEASAKF